MDGEQASRALKIADFIECAVENSGDAILLENPFWCWQSKLKEFYLNPTAACQTNTNKKKNRGISGRTSTVGAKAL